MIRRAAAALLQKLSIVLLIATSSVMSAHAYIGQTSYAYDLNSNLTQLITPRGDAINYQYDDLNRVVAVSASGGANVSYTYDPQGRLTSMSDQSGTSVYVYDTLGRLSAYQQAGIAPFYYYYNSRNQLISLKDPLGLWTYYNYDAGGRLLNDYDFNGYNSYEYHAATGLLVRHYRYGRTETAGNYSFIGYTDYGYDSARRLVQVQHVNQSGQIKARYSFSYDPNGNRTRIIRQIPGQNEYAYYTYDPLDRLTEARYQGGVRDGQLEAYTYDAVGNRLSELTSGGMKQYHYGQDNRLTQIVAPEGVTTFEYDNGGNLVRKSGPSGESHYQYDARNLLVHYEDASHSIAYQYDGAGNRIAKTVNGVTTRYVNHVHMGLPQVALETTAGLNVAKRYSYGKGRTSQYDWNGTWQDQTQYYLYDFPGRSVAETVDRWGNTRNRYQYEAFGDSQATLANADVDFRYVGEARDESGLIYLRSRYYDPSIGRFISRDPFSGYKALPQSQNPYAYAHNNPLRFTDPSGECLPIILFAAFFLGDMVLTSMDNCQSFECNGQVQSVGGLPTVGFAAGTVVSKALGRVDDVVDVAKGLPPLRQQYVDSVSELKGVADSLRASGADIEQIARALHTERRAIGEQFKSLTPPDKLAEIYQRNMQKYGDELGPSIDWLRSQGKSWDQIIESATRTGGKDLGF